MYGPIGSAQETDRSPPADGLCEQVSKRSCVEALLHLGKCVVDGEVAGRVCAAMTSCTAIHFVRPTAVAQLMAG